MLTPIERIASDQKVRACFVSATLLRQLGLQRGQVHPPSPMNPSHTGGGGNVSRAVQTLVWPRVSQGFPGGLHGLG